MEAKLNYPDLNGCSFELACELCIMEGVLFDYDLRSNEFFVGLGDIAEHCDFAHDEYYIVDGILTCGEGFPRFS